MWLHKRRLLWVLIKKYKIRKYGEEGGAEKKFVPRAEKMMKR